jgi:transcriptional regulator with XRE-family HTH domain
MRGWMKHEKKSLRGLGKEMGIDQATLWRFMSGKNPDGDTLAKVLKYALSAAPPPAPSVKGEGK